MFCFWFAPQSASNPNPLQNKKHSRLHNPQEEDEQGALRLLLKIEKTKKPKL
jgi:hypothetical protein